MRGAVHLEQEALKDDIEDEVRDGVDEEQQNDGSSAGVDPEFE